MSLPAALRAALPGEPVRVLPETGGCISQAATVELADGRRVFTKHLPDAPAGFFAAEARGLAWLDTGALPVPRVLAQGAGFLVLEHIPGGEATPAGWEALGRGLAALHADAPPTFGLDHDNFIGRLPQPNPPADTWAAFYRDHRLAPMVRRAHDRGLLDRPLRQTLDRLLDTLPQHLGPPEPPARLHGDLWSGNVRFDDTGQPWLLDPAVAGGHREQDLAMMRLFGGFDDRCYAAYAEAMPLAPGWQDRLPLFQLYPLLVHLVIFGAGYRRQVAWAAGACA